jgi:hypothetical protein
LTSKEVVAASGVADTSTLTNEVVVATGGVVETST